MECSTDLELSEAYRSFIRHHTRRRTGKDRERVKDGLGHAERLFLESIWWPTFAHFDGLHPEYRVLDYRDAARYIDFAYIQPNFRIAIEIDGAGTHWRYITDEQFSDHCLRQNHLVTDGWYVLRFAYRDVQHRPRLCQQTIQQLIGRLLNDANDSLSTLSSAERQIVRFVAGQGHARPVTPGEVALHLRVTNRTAIRHLKALVSQNWLAPSSGDARIRSYQLHPLRRRLRL